ncbi:MAG: DUF2079 domain-containing protein [Chloroflexota bacterium]
MSAAALPAGLTETQPAVRGNARVAAIAATLGGLAFFTLTTWLGWARHAAYATGRYDLEIYVQVAWSITHGQPFATTLLKTNLSHLAEHVALVMIPVGAIYRLVPDPRLLITLQQAALAALAVPVFILARQRLGPISAVITTACFLLSPALAGVALDDFHAVALASLPLGFSVVCALQGRPRAAALLALLSIPLEEETALVAMGLGGYLILDRDARIRRVGAVVGALAALWLALLVFVVMPQIHDPRTISSVGGNRTLGHFAELRRDPASAITRILGPRGLDALVWLGLPTAGLALLAPRTLVIVAPSLAALLLQNRDDTFSRHWVTPILAALYPATVAGISRLQPGARPAALGALAAGTVAAYLLVSPLPGGGTFDPSAIERDERVDLLDRAVARIPPTGVVVASQPVVAHLANRPEAYVFPIDSHYAEELGWRRKRPDYYVLDLFDDLTNRATNSERLNPLNADRPFHVWSAGRKIVVLLNTVADTNQPLDVRFGDRLRLLGYDTRTTRAGERIVTMQWDRYNELRGRYDRDLSVRDATGNIVLYQEDMPLSSVYGSNKWRPGQRILDEVTLPAGTGPLTLRVAWVAQEKRAPFRLADGSEAFEFDVP